jgi:hypothetical protein
MPQLRVLFRMTFFQIRIRLNQTILSKVIGRKSKVNTPNTGPFSDYGYLAFDKNKNTIRQHSNYSNFQIPGLSLEVFRVGL